MALSSNAVKRIWRSRILIFIVVAWNLQAAAAFIFSPRSYAIEFDLSGITGDIMILSIGILFLMWNVPYVMALWHPIKNRISLFEAVAMQAIGLLGEVYILLLLGNRHPIAQETIVRFVIFDTLGLLSLIGAVWSIKLQWIRSV